MLLEKLANSVRHKLMQKLALTVTDYTGMSDNPLSATVGRLNAPVQALLLGTTAPFKGSASLDDPELAAAIEELKENKALDDVHLNLGGTTPIDNLSRVWSNKNISLPSKLLGTVGSPLNDLVTALTRSDNYNVYSNTATLFNPDEALLRHELGHAEDFSEAKNPVAYAITRGLIPGMTLYQEGQASINAIDGLADKLNTEKGEELRGRLGRIDRANRVLGGGFGSYLGAGLGGIAGLAATPALIARYGKKLPAIFANPNINKAIGSTGGAVLGALLGQLIGKATNAFTLGSSRDAYNAAYERE